MNAQRLLDSLPGTVNELGERLGVPNIWIVETLYRLRHEGVVKPVGTRNQGKRGPKPAVWDRVG